MLSLILTFCSFGGVYLLTLNKPDDSVDASMEVIGYLLVLTSACLYGLLFVILRTLSLYKINMLVSPLYIGTGTMIQSIFLMIFTTDVLHFESYQGTNLVILGIIMVCSVIGQFTWTAASTYSAASKMAPLNYAENVFTLLADILIFNYKFISTDVLGMIVIVTCLAVPVIQKIIATN